MNNNTYNFYKKIKIIKGIHFTTREIDVIACITSARTAKGTANLLSISPKTVETHIYNVMSKLAVSSREGIINFIERSEKLALIKRHYTHLLIQCEFETHLTSLADLPTK